MSLGQAFLSIWTATAQMSPKGQAASAVPRLILLTLLMLLLVACLIILIHYWRKSQRRRDTLADLNLELASYETMKRSGLLSEEEHRKITSRLREQILSLTVQQTAKQGETSQSEKTLIEILAAEAAKLEAQKKLGGESPSQKTEE